MDLSKFKDTTIVPIDFTDNSLMALEHAGAIAHIVEHEKHQITLLHVIEGGDLESPYFQGDQMPEKHIKSLMIEGSISRLEKIISNNLDKINADVNYIITSGKVYNQIAEMARKLDADSIVMGTHGAMGFQEFLGSNAARVIQTAPCPTTVVRERSFGSGYKNIVLPLDVTKETKQKVSWAEKVAKYFDAVINIVTVADEDEASAKRINANMNQVETYLKERGINVTSESVSEPNGNYADATLNYAKESDADLIVVMTQQERSISQMIFGSYAQQIVTKSKIPVMCINPRSDVYKSFEVQGFN
ncbi:MAG: hypothetical protein BRD49_05035 [Bacteroidetes bacterium SW_10_40_5]|nr:MAG: hypothetical protein BRD49_05035 [Bacteroidetes bacterium SW_10_40_5]